MSERQPRGCKRSLLSVLGIIGAIILCVGGTTLGLDGACVADVGPRMVIYPGATVISRNHTFFQDFGMGETGIVLHSEDDPEKVRSWYAVTISDVLRKRGSAGTFGKVKWQVERASDGTGSDIALYSQCAM